MPASFLRLLSRPALWLMIYAALLGYGLFALFNIPEEVLPAFNYPEVSVTLHLPGTTATDMEAMAATPLEGVLLGLPGLSNIRSTISDGLVETDLRFAAGTNAEFDLQTVNGAIERALTSLPPGAQPFTQIMGNAINEVADYAVRYAPGTSQAEVARAVATRLVPALRAVPGVQLVDTAGLGSGRAGQRGALGTARPHRHGTGRGNNAGADPGARRASHAGTGRLSQPRP
ncbi:MAG: hypothetical protein B7Z77_11655 [Acidocella sp. 20-58-15]|nr:MAG: hypothetical protein B7Z77_11655 [Acidocella sp. 20-58-15]